VPEIVKNKVSN